MEFTFEENVTTVPRVPFFLPRAIPCPELPKDLVNNWVAEELVPGVRVAFVKSHGEVHAVHDKANLDDWVFMKPCIEHIRMMGLDNFLIDGVVKPYGNEVFVIQADCLGTFHAFDYVPLDEAGLPLMDRKNLLERSICGMPNTQIVVPRKIKGARDLDNYFYTCKELGFLGVVIKRKQSIYETSEQGKIEVDNWQRIP